MLHQKEETRSLVSPKFDISIKSRQPDPQVASGTAIYDMFIDKPLSHNRVICLIGHQFLDITGFSDFWSIYTANQFFFSLCDTFPYQIIGIPEKDLSSSFLSLACYYFLILLSFVILLLFLSSFVILLSRLLSFFKSHIPHMRGETPILDKTSISLSLKVFFIQPWYSANNLIFIMIFHNNRLHSRFWAHKNRVSITFFTIIDTLSFYIIQWSVPRRICCIQFSLRNSFIHIAELSIYLLSWLLWIASSH